jgi:hypothetical protein
MNDHATHGAASQAHHGGAASWLIRQWPYLAMMALALFGVAYTSVTRQGMTIYWIVLAPIFGAISVAAGWPDAEDADERWRLLRTQVLHWGAVLAAMCLVFVGDVKMMMSTDVSALVVLTVLALGAFTAGVHSGAWRVSLVGFVLALFVPAIAWLEESTLLIFLIVAILAAVAAAIMLRDRRNVQ